MNNVLAYPIKEQSTNVIPFKVISNDKPIKLNKDGSVCKIKNNKVAGVSSEVFFLSTDEIKRMREVFKNIIQSASTPHKEKIARRNLLMFNIGIDFGLRISDLRLLKYSDLFFERDYIEENKLVPKSSYTLMPKKTSRCRKFVQVNIPAQVIHYIEEYISIYPFDNINDYVFMSQQRKPIDETSFWKVLNDVAHDAKIRKNIGTHSLRKTFGYHAWHNSNDKSKTLVELQKMFNHSTTIDTMKYIGILNEDFERLYNLVAYVLNDD